MDFKTFFFAMPIADRDAFAERANTSRGLLTQVAYRNKQIELGLADVIVALTHGEVPLVGLPLTENALRQHSIRQGASAPVEQGG
jgi:hypothetical protein